MLTVKSENRVSWYLKSQLLQLLSILKLLQCTLYNTIQYYSILGTIRSQFNVPAFLYSISKNNSKIEEYEDRRFVLCIKCRPRNFKNIQVLIALCQNGCDLHSKCTQNTRLVKNSDHACAFASQVVFTYGRLDLHNVLCTSGHSFVVTADSIGWC